MKKAVALIITLVFVTFFIHKIAQFLQDYRQYTQDTYHYVLQDRLIIKDIKQILSSIDIDANTLDYLFQTYPISSKNDNFKLRVCITPLSDKLNINELALIPQKKAIIQYLTNVLNFYHVYDPQYFIDLLLDTIDKDTQERNPPSEIALYDKTFLNGKIYNYKHFAKILDFYAKNREDKRIYLVKWRDLIYFGDKRKYMIDANREHISKFMDYDEKFQQILDIIPFDKKTSYLIKISVNGYIEIIYDIYTKRIVDIADNILY
ncbi:MAG: hypothetical protein GXO40_06975 [Epsilonproteobacteria bacterium]|nr:hypothetical protein [Campylobacterota bacterium]